MKLISLPDKQIKITLKIEDRHLIMFIYVINKNKKCML